MARIEAEKAVLTSEKRWEAIATSIRGAIRRGELHAGARIASETEMALQWNVSPMTVHRALTELQQEGWVVRRRKVGTVVADRSSIPLTRIALIVSNPAVLPQGAYVTGIEESLGDSFQLVPYNTYNSIAEEAKFLKAAAEECSAIICLPTGVTENTALLKKAAAAKPLVLIDCTPDGVQEDTVMTDNFGSMQAGLHHLKSLGHSRIAYFLEHPIIVTSAQDRYSAYLDFMAQEAGVANPERWVRRFANMMSWELYYPRVEAALIELLNEPDPITAIACQQDSVMTTVIEACVNLGISVDSDLAVLSFNDLPSKMQPLAHRVHRLVQRPIEMGHMAAKRIILRLNNPDLPLQQLRLMADLFPAIGYKPSESAVNFIEARNRSK